MLKTLWGPLYLLATLAGLTGNLYLAAFYPARQDVLVLLNAVVPVVVFATLGVFCWSSRQQTRWETRSLWWLVALLALWLGLQTAIATLATAAILWFATPLPDTALAGVLWSGLMALALLVTVVAGGHSNLALFREDRRETILYHVAECLRQDGYHIEQVTPMRLVFRDGAQQHRLYTDAWLARLASPDVPFFTQPTPPPNGDAVSQAVRS